MKKAIIIYGSTTGNTEEMAGMVKAALEDSDFDVDMKDAADAEVGDMTAGHDLLLMGCPAYGDDTIELQEDFQDFYEKWGSLSLDGKNFAVFAPGDSSYEFFCGSVDYLQEQMQALGGSLVTEGLKIDGEPSGFKDDISEWVASIPANMG